MDRTALNALVVELTARGDLDREQVFRELRTRGMSPLETIYVVTRTFGISLPEAKTAIYESAAWRDQTDDWARLQSGLTDGADGSGSSGS
ncbi:hypothetical protein ACFWSF_34385 [Streptomyces sp. NPDC058611]|uniref:hypothetical protein n=1 Tax=unclassified Streptomyces TaxID=2593676 RepID=UPI00366217ED